MKDETKDYEDALIDEVRERRRQLFEECGSDFDTLFKRIEERQGKQQEKPRKPPARTTSSVSRT